MMLDHRGIGPVTDPVQLASALQAIERQPFYDEFWNGWGKLPPGTKFVIGGELFYKMADQPNHYTEGCLFSAKTGYVHSIGEYFVFYEGFAKVEATIQRETMPQTNEELRTSYSVSETIDWKLNKKQTLREAVINQAVEDLGVEAVPGSMEVTVEGDQLIATFHKD